jgi:hypothetical protein
MLLAIRMLLAWMLAVVGSTVVATLTRGALVLRGNAFDGILGIGLIVGLPMLVFSAVIALPVSYYLIAIRPSWLATLAAMAVFGFIAAALGAVIFPAGWKGAAQAFVAFAALLGLFWGLIGLVMIHFTSAP